MNEEALPHIALSYEDRIPKEMFDDFQALIEADGLDFVMEPRKTSGPFAGIEWLLPTAVILFVTQSYFAGFLGEMGKDHYVLFKQGVKGLRERFNRVKVTMIGTPGKVSAEQPYSMVYSIYLDGIDGKQFKFLVPSAEYDPATGELAMDAFFEFLEAYYGGDLEPQHTEMLFEARGIGRTVLLAFDPATGLITPINPITRQFETGLPPEN